MNFYLKFLGKQEIFILIAKNLLAFEGFLDCVTDFPNEPI